MKPRVLPDGRLRELAERFGTPLHVLRADLVRERLAELRAAGSGRGFDLVRYAQKANPNLALLQVLRAGGARVDAVSAGELERARRAGFEAGQVSFCCDLFDRPALAALADWPAAVTVGSADMLEPLAALRPGARVTLRVNPGFGHGHHVKVTTGGAHSKHGVWHADLPATIARARALGLEVEGLHVHVGSGVEPEHLTGVLEAMRGFARAVGPSLASISAGGGLPIPYRQGEPRCDLDRLADAWDGLRTEVEGELGRALSLEVEPGRYLVAEAGLLLGEVRGRKRTDAIDYVLVDAGFGDLVRPAMYGAYHQVSVVGRDDEPTEPRVVAGPLCESADVFTQGPDGELAPRPLPDARLGDLVCLHDTGAYGAAMASTYNSRPLAAEVLVDGDDARLVRRRQTIAELLDPEDASART